MAVTNKAKRHWLLKQRFLQASPKTFSKQYDCLSGLLVGRQLSIPNCRWCSRAILEMRSCYSAAEHGELLDNLDAKVDGAFARAKARREGREEKKRAKPGPKPITTLPPLPELDPWQNIDVSQFLETDLADAEKAGDK